MLLCDAGHQRNLRSPCDTRPAGTGRAISGRFLDEAREELSRYKSVSVRDTLVEGITPAAEGFEFVCTDGTAGRASKVLLATGLVDELPELAGIEPLYGISVHHCLYCDGFEYAGKPVAAYGKGDKGAELADHDEALDVDVVACSDGTEVSAEAIKSLKNTAFPYTRSRSDPWKARTGSSRGSSSKSGTELARSGLFFSTGCHQASDLSKSLGCKRNDKGGVVIDPETEESSVPGVYVAGDVSRDVLLVAVAIGEGAQAAVAINKAFLRRDGFCD